MKILTKEMQPLKFKGCNMMDTACHNHYRRAFPKQRRILIVDNHHQAIYHYSLTENEWEQWKEGTFAVVPMGCVGGFSGNPTTEEYTIDMQGDFRDVFRTKKALLAFIGKTIKKMQS